MSSESEGIADGNIYISADRLVEGKVKPAVNFGIIRKMVDGWGDDSIPQGQDGSNGLHGSGGPQKVTGHRFGGTDAQLISVLTEKGDDRLGFGDITQGS